MIWQAILTKSNVLTYDNYYGNQVGKAMMPFWTKNKALTYGRYNGNWVEEAAREGPRDGVLRLVAVPALLFESNDQTLLELSKFVSHFWGPIILA